MAWGTVPSRTTAATAAVPTPVNLYQQQFQQWQQQQQQVQEHHRLEQERQKKLEEELKVELQQQLQRQMEEKAKQEEEERRLKQEEEERRQQEEKEREERRKREAEEEERRAAEAEAARQQEERSRYMRMWQDPGVKADDQNSKPSEGAKFWGHDAQAPGRPQGLPGLPGWPAQSVPLPHLHGQVRQPHQPQLPSFDSFHVRLGFPHSLPLAHAPVQPMQPVQPIQPVRPVHPNLHPGSQAQPWESASPAPGDGRPSRHRDQPDEEADDPTEPSASPQAPDNDDADTEAPTEESDYDPFAGAQGKEPQEYNPFAEAESAVGMEDDGEDEGAFDSLIEMLRAAEREGNSAPSRMAEETQPQQKARPLDTGEQFQKAKPKPKTHYHFNHATQRWEPKAAPPSPPREPSRGDRFQRELPSRNTPASPPRQAPRKLVIAECEAEARADAANSFCSFSQALAVRLALRFESRPKDILVSMSEAGLPAAKDQRSTVKTIMRLCHPDKCKHPDAKRAMQILGPQIGRAHV